MRVDLLPHRYRVAARRVETDDTATLTLDPDGESIARPAAGQFTMVSTFGGGEIPVSVSSVPDDEGRCLGHTVRRVGLASSRIASLVVGDVVGVRGPFGSGWRVEDAGDGSDIVVVAGGLGLAPLRPLVIEIIAARGRFGSVSVLVGARRPDEVLFHDDITEWGRSGGLEVLVTVDVGAPTWPGEVGLVTSLLRRATFDPATTHAFVCGPEVMMRATARALVDRGVGDEHVHLSLERNMQCGVRRCGQCQLGPRFVCADGPVVDWHSVRPSLEVLRW